MMARRYGPSEYICVGRGVHGWMLILCKRRPDQAILDMMLTGHLEDHLHGVVHFQREDWVSKEAGVRRCTRWVGTASQVVLNCDT